LYLACSDYINDLVRNTFDIQGHCHTEDKLSQEQRELMQASMIQIATARNATP
jgi:hypothetical protein